MFILKWLSYTTRLIIVASLFLTVTILINIFINIYNNFVFINYFLEKIILIGLLVWVKKS